MGLEGILNNARKRLNDWGFDKTGSYFLTRRLRLKDAVIGLSMTGLLYLTGCGCGGGSGGGGDGPPKNKAPVVSAVFADVSLPEDTATAVALAGHFKDPEGQALTYSTSGFNADMAVEVNGGELDIYSTTPNYNGTQTGSVKACDPKAKCVTTPLKVTFTPVNDPPEIDGATMYSAIEGAYLDGKVNVSDIDLDTVTCALLNNGGLAQLQVNADCTISSAAPLPYNTFGSYTASVQASDGVGGVTPGNVQINIVNVNRKPVVTSVTITTAQEEMALLGYVNRTDADGDPTTCELVSSDIPEARVAPDGAVYSCAAEPCDPAAPDPLPKGSGGNSRTLEVRCTDNFEVSDNFTRNLRVEGFPVVSAIPDQSTLEDIDKAVDVAPYFSDPNNDSLTYFVQGLSAISANVSGSVITFSAPLNYNGSETAQIKACDPWLCTSDNVLVTFTPVNDAPAVDGVTMYSSIEGEFLNGVVGTSDVDGDAVTCSLVNNGGLTELVINSNCAITSSSALPYTRSGTYNVTVRANDGSLDTDSIVQIIVADNTPANKPPVVDVPFALISTPEESITSESILGHFSDPNVGDTLTYFVSDFTTITAVLNGNTIQISAHVNYNGIETGLATACDPAPACVSTPLQIAYTAVNDNPTLSSIVINLAREGALLDGQMNAADPDLVYGDILTYSIMDKTELPELQVNPATGQLFSTVPLSYTPAYQNPYVLLKVNDLAGAEDGKWYQINIENVNRAPTITDVVFDFAEEGTFLIGGINGNDPDGDSVNCYLVSSNLPELKVSPGCSIYSDAPLPSAAPVNYNVVVRMTDGTLEDTFSKDFEVQRPPTTPYTTYDGNPCGPNFGVDETPIFPLTFTLNSTDPNGDPITYQSSTLPTGATLDPNTGVFSWSPDCTQGDQMYTVGFHTKDDKNLLSTVDTVWITVTDVCPP